jgi:parvulin-like peptidyl-prolyl isomerase
MLAAFRSFWSWRSLRRGALAAGGLAAVAAGVWCSRGAFIHRAAAQPVPAPAAAAAAGVSDYANRVVAYIHGTQAITRQDLGEYLIARYGAEKLQLLLNHRLLEKACAERHIVVNAAEVDAALANDLKGMGVMKLEDFAKTLQARYKKSLPEWKQDVLRPRLLMARLVEGRLRVTDEDVRKAYDSVYGEKVECRLILWPTAQKNQAFEEYARLRDSEEAFAEKAKKQSTSALAATGGRIRPVTRYSMNKAVEDEAFKLAPGAVSTLIDTPEGIVLLKCDRRIPADTTVNIAAVKDKLAAQIHEAKLQNEIKVVFTQLRNEARPQACLKKSDRPATGPTPPPSQPVAFLYGTEPVTREELGEFLIARYGADKLEFLINRRIIDEECKARNITVTDAEVDAAFKEDLKGLGVTAQKDFEEKLLARWGKNMYEWREDVLRAKLLLGKLCKDRVKCTEDDLKKCYEALHGERVECRMIMWPKDQLKGVRALYPNLRDHEEDFQRAAKTQPSTQLASNGGVIPPFGRHAFGNDDVERAAFALQPGETTPLIETPEGIVMLKCDKRFPADGAPLAALRDELTREVLKKKVAVEMVNAFKEFREKAQPKALLHGSSVPEDLVAESQKLLSSGPPTK